MENAKAKDFLLCIGTEFYTPESFRAEAANQGISRRIPRVPTDLIPGESRIYLAFGAGKDSVPRKCSECGLDLPPVSKALKLNGVTPIIQCDACKSWSVGKGRKAGVVSAYFVPEAVEVVFKLDDQGVRDVASSMLGLGFIKDAKVDDADGTFRVHAIAREGFELNAVAELAALSGAEVKVDVLAGVLALPGARIAGVASEPKRGCGFRKTGGVYIVGGPTVSPLIEITPPIPFTGQHFRGISALEDEQADEFRRATAPGAAQAA